MHTLSPYTIRCFDPKMTVPIEERYAVLSKIGTHDTFGLLTTFLKSLSTEYSLVEEKQVVFKFSDLNFNSKKRIVYGWLEAGSYGYKSDIINVETGKVDFEKSQKNAEIIKHYIQFFLPKDFNEGIAFFHTFGNHGVKTLFYELFNNFFNSITNLTLQMNPLGYEKALKEWQEASAKEIILTRFEGLTAIEDQIANLGHEEVFVTLRPPRRGTLGTLKDYLNPESKEAKAIELIAENCSKIKTIVEINGKRRTFSIGPSQHENAICQIDLDETVILNQGNPELPSIHSWATEILKEYCTTIYPDMEVTL